MSSHGTTEADSESDHPDNHSHHQSQEHNHHYHNHSDESETKSTPKGVTAAAAAATTQQQQKEQQQQPIKITAKYGDTLSPNGANGDNQSGTSSVVSFQTTCDLYEVDLEKGDKSAKPRPTFYKSVRYYVMLLALISPFVTTYSKTIINFAITDMIDPECVQAKSSRETSDLVQQDGANCTMAYFEFDNSCPVDEADRARLIDSNKNDIERAHNSIGEKFKWDTFYQGILKSAYAVGHAPFQIPGSRLSERYGSHWVMSISSALIAICCLLAPYLAAAHFYLLYLDLFLLGVLGSFMTPALITFFSNWLTPSEKAITLSFYLIASRLGYALSAFLCGLLISAQLSWRYVFFSAGFISFAFSATFLVFARSRPQDHPLVGQQELDYLATKNTLVRESLARRRARDKLAQQQLIEGEKLRQMNYELKPTTRHRNGLQQRSKPVSHKEAEVTKSRKKAAPWFAILTNVPVWAFIITKFCVKLAGDTVQIELPTYLSRVMHYDAAENGKINAWMYIIFCGGCFMVGALAKSVSKSQPFGLSKTAIRKIFQCVASFGVALAIIGIAFSVCNKGSTEACLMLVFLVTTFGTGGEAQIPLDITERYAGTIHALASSLAISSAVEPILVGFIMRGHAADKERWKAVWLGAGSIASFGGIVFLLFADARIQPFDFIGVEQQEEKEKKKDDGNNNNTKKQACKDNKAFVIETIDQNNNVTPKDTNSLEQQQPQFDHGTGTHFRESAEI